MRSDYSLFPLFAAGCTAFALVAAVFVSTEFAAAEEQLAGNAPGCSCPNSSAPANNGKPQKPKYAGLNAPLDANDEIAALESVQFALSQVADGSTYVWHRSHGRLSGMVRPMSSFKDHRGQICRHILVVLNGLDDTKKTEAIACRLTSGIWELDG